MVWDVIGVTGWTLPAVCDLTFPQLTFVLEGRGRILYPRLEPAINANLSNLSAEPGPKGEPSEADKVIQRYQQAKAGSPAPQTQKEKTLAYARRILLMPYLGDPDVVEDRPQGNPSTFPGMGKDEAEAWVAWVKSGQCPDSVWLEICEVYEAIWNTARAEPV